MFNLESLRRVTSGNRYLPVIDGLRFCAIMPVVLWHLNSRAWRAFSARSDGNEGQALFETLNRWLGAKTGVELFFVISGFILAMPFLRASREGRPGPSLKAFYLRRLTRLEPPYILATLAAFLFLFFTMSDAAKAMFAANNGYTLFDSLAASLLYVHGSLLKNLPEIIPVAWSLEIEFQFYILAPLIFYVFLVIKSNSLRSLIGILLMSILVLSINLIQEEIGSAIRFLLFRYLHFFILGVVICHIFLAKNLLSNTLVKTITWDFLFLLALVTLMATETLMTDYRRQTPVFLELFRLLALGVLFFSAFSGRVVSKLLSSAPVSLIGGMCYSIYLIHLPLQQVIVPKLVALVSAEYYWVALGAVVAICLPLTLLVSLLFYLLVERPCMRPDWPQRLWARVREPRLFLKEAAPPGP